MKCPNCENDRFISEGYEVLDFESSTSNWDEWDQILKLKCKECGHEFTHID